MQIFVDADAFPNVIRDILIKASLRLNVPLLFVANKPLRLEKLANISLILVPEGLDVADDRIARLVHPGDLVITADIPLADRVVAKKAFAINPRGKLYTEHNIKDRLAIWNRVLHVQVLLQDFVKVFEYFIISLIDNSESEAVILLGNCHFYTIT
jgi:uncharacterized protein YaiI (UPF0178 family)